MTTVVISPPAEEPISLATAKLHLRVDSSDDDALINALIATARRQAEQETRRYLITQTLERTLDAFPCALILPPLQSVSSIKYLDAAGVLQTLAAEQYVVDALSAPARISRAESVDWPTTRAQHNAVTIRFVAGYGAAAAVPETIKQWMLLQIGHWYANREASSQKLEPLPFVDSLLNDSRVDWYS